MPKKENNFIVVETYIKNIIKSFEAIIKRDRYGLYKNEDAWQLAIKAIKKTKVEFKDISHEKVLEILEIFLEKELQKQN